MDGANETCVGPVSEDAGKASSCAGCPNQADCASGKTREAMANDPTAEHIRQRLAGVKHIILVLSGKGGVGKSSVSCQLAWSLAHAGKYVGVLDIDICGPSVPRMMGVESEEVRRSNLGWTPVYATDNIAVMSVGFMLPSRNDAVVWRGPRKNGLIRQFLTDVEWGSLDYLIIDAPPGTSDEHISITSFMKGINPDGAVIVTTPQEMALLDVRKEISFCRKVDLPILGVVENMSGYVCPCCDKKSDVFGKGGKVLDMCTEMDVKRLGSLPLDPAMLQACEDGVCFVERHPDSPTTDAMMALIESIMNCSPELSETWITPSDE